MELKRPEFPAWPAWVGIACFTVMVLIVLDSRPKDTTVSGQGRHEVVSVTLGENKCEPGWTLTAVEPDTWTCTSPPIAGDGAGITANSSTVTVTGSTSITGPITYTDDSAPFGQLGMASGGGGWQGTATADAPVVHDPVKTGLDVTIEYYDWPSGRACPMGAICHQSKLADLVLGVVPNGDIGALQLDANGYVILSRRSEDRIVRRLQQWLDRNEADRPLPKFRNQSLRDDHITNEDGTLKDQYAGWLEVTSDPRYIVSGDARIWRPVDGIVGGPVALQPCVAPDDKWAVYADGTPVNPCEPREAVPATVR